MVNLSHEVVVGDVAQFVGGQVHGAPTEPVSGVALNSVKVQRGDLFAALPGHHSHGARHVEQALAAGAVAVLTDPDGFEICASICEQRAPIIVVSNPREVVGPICARIYGPPKIPLIGITGTNGKTTTAFMVYEGIKAAGKKAGMVGTLATYIGDDVVPSARTTPEAPDIYQLLRTMQEDKVEIVVMEVSSIAIAEHRIGGLVFDVVGFTNLSHDHLDYHGTMDTYFETKASLFTPQYAKCAVINTTQTWGKRLLEQSTIATQSLKVCDSFQSCDSVCDWCGEFHADGTMNIKGPHGEIMKMAVETPGIVNAENALLAVALLHNVGVDSEHVRNNIGAASVPGRGELIGQSQGVNVYVDYAHSPDASTTCLSGLVLRTAGSVITVIGAGGDRDRSKRGEMGRAAAEFSSHVIVTDDNPRSEDPSTIREAVAAGARDEGNAVVEIVQSRRHAIERAITLAKPGDAVAILGKGHESTIEVRGSFEIFSDAEVARELMSRV